MKRSSFLKTLGAMIIAPKILENITEPPLLDQRYVVPVRLGEVMIKDGDDYFMDANKYRNHQEPFMRFDKAKALKANCEFVVVQEFDGGKVFINGIEKI